MGVGEGMSKYGWVLGRVEVSTEGFFQEGRRKENGEDMSSRQDGKTGLCKCK